MALDRDNASGDIAASSLAAMMLAQGKMIHSATLIFTISALCLAGLVLALRHSIHGPAFLAACCLVTALAEFYFAMRTSLDTAIFQALAKGEIAIDNLDTELSRLGLMPPQKMGRPVTERIDGALRLMRQQIACMLLTVVFFLAEFIAVIVSGAGVT